MLFSRVFGIFRNHVRETDRNRRTAAADKEVTRRGLPSYRQVQDGEISYEEAVLELADHMGWVLDTAYRAAYPETYITKCRRKAPCFSNGDIRRPLVFRNLSMLY